MRKPALKIIFAVTLCALKEQFTNGEICGGNTTTSSLDEGNITSPGYPNDYQNNLMCTWTIQILNNQSLELQFHDFQLEYGYGNNGQCHDLYAGILQITDIGSSKVIMKECGQLSPFSFLVETGVKIELSTGRFETRKGFFLSWKVRTQTKIPKEPPRCGFNSNSLSGNFSFPNGDYNYRGNITCVWTISTSPGTGIVLAVHQFHLTPRKKYLDNYRYDRYAVADLIGIAAYGRFWDFFDVLQITDATLGKVIFEHSGELDPFILVSNNKATIRFTSHRISPATRFSISWTAHTKAVGPVNADRCVYTKVADVGYFSSINYRLRNTPEIRCNWSIHILPGFRLLINLNDFSQRHCDDFIKIRAVETKKVLSITNGCDSLSEIHMSSNESVDVSTLTASAYSGGGLSLTWFIVPTNLRSYQSSIYSLYMSENYGTTAVIPTTGSYERIRPNASVQYGYNEPSKQNESILLFGLMILPLALCF